MSKCREGAPHGHLMVPRAAWIFRASTKPSGGGSQGAAVSRGAGRAGMPQGRTSCVGGL